MSSCPTVREAENGSIPFETGEAEDMPFAFEVSAFKWFETFNSMVLMKDSSMPKVLLHAEIAPSPFFSRNWYVFTCSYLFLHLLLCHQTDRQANSYYTNLPLPTCSQTTSFNLLMYYQLLFLFHSEAIQHHSRTMKVSCD